MSHEGNTPTSRRCTEERNLFVAVLNDLCVRLCQMTRLLAYTVHVLLECCVGGVASQIRSDIVVKPNVQAQLTIRREQPASSQHQSANAHDWIPYMTHFLAIESASSSTSSELLSALTMIGTMSSSAHSRDKRCGQSSNSCSATPAPRYLYAFCLAYEPILSIK
jgi:hypothetical protein